ncbi:MAG TPA: inositol monophosphatase family protein [bacterium]|nr:inositol monophosphatase family protein [bacterium]HPP29569.1 inositol monophosphatase family protein [bacterium]
MESRFNLAIGLVKEAGDFLRRGSGSGEISIETAYDVKLKQDVESESIIIGGIEKSFPEDGYISEEKGEKKGSSGYIWIIDPLDGTVNYYRGIPHCSISIACIGKEDGFGVVYDFFRNEMFTAEKGKGAYINGSRIKVSKTSKLKDAIISFGLMKGKEEIQDGLNLFCNIADKVKKIRMMGSAALDICYVAAGRTDVFFEVGLNIWDIAAGKIIVEEAGGVYNEYLKDNKRFFLVSNGFINLERIWQNH